MLDPSVMRGGFDVLVSIVEAILHGVQKVVEIIEGIINIISKIVGVIRDALFWLPLIGDLVSAGTELVKALLMLTGLFNDFLKWCISNSDVIAYFILVLLYGFTIGRLIGASALIGSLPMSLAFMIVLFPFVPAILFGYYTLFGLQGPAESKELVKIAVFGFPEFCIKNLDVTLYLLFVSFGLALITYQTFTEILKLLLPDFIFWDIVVILLIIILTPAAILLYYMFNGFGFWGGLSETRKLTYMLKYNLTSAIKKIFGGGS